MKRRNKMKGMIIIKLNIPKIISKKEFMKRMKIFKMNNSDILEDVAWAKYGGKHPLVI